jgi:hypothetical protein
MTRPHCRPQRSISSDRDRSPIHRYRRSSLDSETAATAQKSMTILCLFDPMDPDIRERQHMLNVNLAIHLSRACQDFMSMCSQSPKVSPLTLREHHDKCKPKICPLHAHAHVHHKGAAFSNLSLQEEWKMEMACGHTQLHAHPHVAHSVDMHMMVGESCLPSPALCLM